MFSARKRKVAEREVPAWRRALGEAAEPSEPRRGFARGEGSETGEGQGESRGAAEERGAREACGATSEPSPRRREAPALLENDDDDDDVDLSVYQLEEEEEGEADAQAEPPAAVSSCRVVVSNLAHDTSSHTLTDFFAECGPILAVEASDERVATLTFGSRQAALLAVGKTGGMCDGRRLVVLLETPATSGVGATSSGGVQTVVAPPQMIPPRAASAQEQLATYGYKLGGRGSRTVFVDDDKRSREKLQRREERRAEARSQYGGRPAFGQAGANIGPI